jgi:hypothetical protein
VREAAAAASPVPATRPGGLALNEVGIMAMMEAKRQGDGK